MFGLQNLMLIIAFGCCNYVFTARGQQCSNFTCGNVNLSYPFWRINDTSISNVYCGYEGFGINCTNGKAMLTISNQIYVVKDINYNLCTLQVMDVAFMGQTCPTPHHNYTLISNILQYSQYHKNLTVFSNCSTYLASGPHLSCLGSTGKKRSYALWEYEKHKVNWTGNCEKVFVIPILDSDENPNISDSTYSSILQEGFPLVWNPNSTNTTCRQCEAFGGQCGYTQDSSDPSCFCPDGTGSFTTKCSFHGNLGSRPVAPPPMIVGNVSTKLTQKTKIIIGLSTGVGVLVLIMLFDYRKKFCSFSHLIYKWSIKTRNNTNVEVFLKNYGCLAPHRYTYSDLKKITNGFKDKLGQGGYGGVYKGRLNDGRFVAVKVLNESKGNGEEFINEVATIGMTNHVNIVSLIGFCSEGTKRALVYDFMPNGSLEKFIYKEKSTSTMHPLGLEKLYQIALGIANGLEYLHRGCNTRILHFDIKPHNILLDKDFCPKISDFGLAKLCLTRESAVSMINARGTVGYIAPEVYCRNIGTVSHKSDVYSYGMLVLEMVGGRRNIDVTMENTSEIYYPHWVYNNLEQERSIGSEGFKEILEESKRKMVIVGLWCIQTNPANRPSMSMVVEMLQKSVEDLQMPPNPFLDHPTSSHSSS